MNKKLLEHIKHSDIEKTIKSLNYAFFDKGLYNLNIIGVRADLKRKVTNKFDDILILIYKTYDRVTETYYFPITTEPGEYYMSKELGNPKGTAILVPGQYRGCWKIGKHNGKYEALIQAKPVKVYRDGNKDDVYDISNDVIDEGIFGINIHRSNQGFTRETVDMYSAGCQVFSNPKDFSFFMYVCKEQASRYGNSFTYTLINEKDLI